MPYQYKDIIGDFRETTMGNIVFSNVSFLFDMKKCTKCGEIKELDQFCKNNANKDGVNNSCKSCRKLLNKNNTHIIKEYNKRYKQQIPNPNKNYKQLPPDYNKIYYINNKEKIKKQIKANWVYKYNNDPLFKLSNDIRVSINRNIKSLNFTKSKRTEEILGCTFEEFKLYLESKFEPWMTWENKGYPKDGVFEFNKNWDVDHILPISSATTEGEIIKLNHFSNFQPLCSKVNREIKRNLLDY